MFYDKIKNWSSLRTIKFTELKDVNAQLEIITSNPNIKKAYLKIKDSYITESIVKKLKELLLNKDENGW